MIERKEKEIMKTIVWIFRKSMCELIEIINLILPCSMRIPRLDPEVERFMKSLEDGSFIKVGDSNKL